jgi:hypothetical protein
MVHGAGAVTHQAAADDHGTGEAEGNQTGPTSLRARAHGRQTDQDPEQDGPNQPHRAGRRREQCQEHGRQRTSARQLVGLQQEIERAAG